MNNWLKIALAVCAVGGASGCKNPSTPAGYEGYLTQGVVAFGQEQYVGTQKGPTSYGLGWQMSVVNVSITPYTFDESFEGNESVITKDDLKISFRVHTIFRINPDKVKEFVEQYSTLHEGKDPDKVVEVAYDNFLKERLRTYARDEIEKVNGFDLKGNITPIGDKILTRVKGLTDGTPFEVDSVIVGNIQYPQNVADAVAAKLATIQKLEQMDTEVKIEQKKRQQRVVEAQGIAEAMAVINRKLTPSYLQYLAIDAQKAMVGSPNHTTIYIPSGANGVPLVGTLNVDQSQNAPIAEGKKTSQADPAPDVPKQ